MSLVEVNIEDVYPYEDEYGNQFLSRDYSTKENQAYLDELARSMSKKGIPDEPVQLVEDGGIYRIKAGNSRVMAMRKLGTKKFPAVIYEEHDLTESIETAIRTNVKKKYEPVEESRFVQQLMAFSSDEYVAAAINMEVEKVKHIRKGREAVDDAADDMTLDRLYAIADVADSPEDVKKLENCKPNEWVQVHRSILYGRKEMAKYQAIEAACEKLGITLHAKAPKGARLAERLYCIEADSAEKDITKHANADSQIIVCEKPGVKSSWLEVFVYEKPADVTDEQAEKIASANALKRAMTADKKQRATWVAGRMQDAGEAGLKNTLRHFTKLVKGWSYHCNRFKELSGMEEIPTVANLWMVAEFWEQADGMTQDQLLAICKGDKTTCNLSAEGMRDLAKRHMAFLDALKADGYKPTDSEQSLYDQAAKLAKGAK